MLNLKLLLNKKYLSKLFGFTLAEIMIVLSVIGILTAILLPIVASSIPDKNVMKFKKADTTLKNVIHELVTSDKYYKDGDLSKMPNGSYVNSPTYFCQTFADMVNAKSVNCQSINTDANGLSHYNITYDSNSEVAGRRNIDAGDFCTKAITKGMEAEIITSDGVVYYETNPAYHFGVDWNAGGKLFINYADENGFNTIYKPFCIDVDGINKGEPPFAYGIRVDGKILISKRATEWLEKGFQKGKNDN